MVFLLQQSQLKYSASRHYSREMRAHGHPEACSGTFPAALLQTAQMFINGPTTGPQMSKPWHIHTTEYYSATKKEWGMSNWYAQHGRVSKWFCWTKGAKKGSTYYCMMSFTWNSREDMVKKQVVSGAGTGESMTAKKHERTLWVEICW